MRLKIATLVFTHLAVVAVALPALNHHTLRDPVSNSSTEKSGIRLGDRSNDIVEHLTFQTVTCDADQIQAISTAVRRAQIQVSTANTYMQHFSRPEDWNEHMTDMFGDYNPERAQTARDVIERMHRVDFSTLIYKCEACLDDDIAHTLRLGYPKMTLCDSFFELGYQAGALIHEVSHFARIGSTLDWKYQKDSSIQLAKTRPELAIGNADNYHYFITGFPPTTECTAPQIEAIIEAAKKSDDLSIDASDTFIDGEWSEHIKTWFGAHNTSRENTIRANLEKFVGHSFLKYEYICLSQCDPGEIGQTEREGFPNVHLCPTFFETPIEQNKNNLAAGNLIEMVAVFEDIANANSDPEVSGPIRTRKYAIDHPDTAYLHADTYRQFAIHTQEEGKYCNDAQLEYLAQVADIARNQMQGANQLAHRDLYWPDKMKTWFGARSATPTKSTLVRKKIQAIFEVNYDKLLYLCPEHCDPLTFGYPNPGEDFDVVLCPRFFPMANANVIPTRSAGALIEIVSHFKNVANANFEPEAHTPDDCKRLARDTMIDAVYNAASYRHFAKEFSTGNAALEVTGVAFQNDQLLVASEY